MKAQLYAVKKRRLLAGTTTMKREQTLALALPLVALAVFNGLSVGKEAYTSGRQPTDGATRSSGTLICKRPAIPEHQVDVERCQLDKSENPKQWKYLSVIGKDYFQSTYGPQTRPCSICDKGSSMKIDAPGHGQQDWCVRIVPAQTAATAAPSCPSGFTWNGEICTRTGVPAHNEGIDRCHGDWSPLDNTSNWTYRAEQGPDLFKRNNGAAGERSCTKCPNSGSIQQDFKGHEDWCVKLVPAVPPATVQGNCPQGFTLGPP